MIINLNNLSLKKIYTLLIVLASVAIIISSCFGFYNIYYSYKNQQTWIRYSNNTLKKNQLLGELKGLLGYGGMIHNFRDYILKQEKNTLVYLIDQIAQTKFIIDRLKEVTIPEERFLLSDISKTIDEYEDKISVAMNMLTQKISVDKIYNAVAVDDTIALNAFDKWETLLKKTSLEQQESTEEWLQKDLMLAYITIPITIFILILVSFIMFYTLRHRIMNPLLKMGNSLDKIIDGKVESFSLVHNNDEMGVFANKLLKVLDLSRNVISHSKLLNNIPIGVMIYQSSDLKIKYANNALKTTLNTLSQYVSCDTNNLHHSVVTEIFRDKGIEDIINQLAQGNNNSYHTSFHLGNKHLSLSFFTLDKSDFAGQTLVILKDVSKQNEAKIKIIDFISKLTKFSLKLEKSINKIASYTGYIKQKTFNIEKLSNSHMYKVEDAHKGTQKSLSYAENMLQKISVSNIEAAQHNIDISLTQSDIGKMLESYNKLTDFIKTLAEKSEYINMMIINTNLSDSNNNDSLSILASETKLITEEASKISDEAQTQNKNIDEQLSSLQSKVKVTQLLLTKMEDLSTSITRLAEKQNICTTTTYKASQDNRNNIKEVYESINDINENAAMAHRNINQLTAMLDDLSRYSSSLRELANIVHEMS